MGHPKKQKKKYESPKKPYDKSRIESEKNILKEFGLRRKHEIWRAESMLRNFRRRARELLARPDEKKEKDLFQKLHSLGVTCLKLDDILGVSLENILSRRLQTVVFKKGLANTSKQARQLIVHGHVSIDGKKIRWPSYLMQSNEEDKITVDLKIESTVSPKEEKGVEASV